MTDQLNAAATAKILDVTPYTLRKWCDEGMPYIVGPDGQWNDRFVISEILQWHIDKGGLSDIDERTMSASEAKRRREVALALSAELDLAVKREQLVVIDDLMLEFSAALIDVRASLTSQPNRLNGLLAHQPEDKVAEILNADIEDILTKLSAYQHTCQETND